MDVLVADAAERLAAVEEALRRYYDAYEARLRRVEERLRSGYHPLWEREADNLSSLLKLLSRALRLAREARGAVSAGVQAARVRLVALSEEAKRLRDDVLYGAVRVPSEVKARILTLYMLVEKLRVLVGGGSAP